jgi:hypothetical protein
LQGPDFFLGGLAFLVPHRPYGQQDAAGGGHQPGQPGEQSDDVGGVDRSAIFQVGGFSRTSGMGAQPPQPPW